LGLLGALVCDFEVEAIVVDVLHIFGETACEDVLVDEEFHCLVAFHLLWEKCCHGLIFQDWLESVG
jgi:hypothetical protein